MLSSLPRQIGQLRNRPARIQTVCVVDPQSRDYQGWDSLAEANGFRLQLVASAEEAHRCSRTTTIDLWVVNTELPGLSGYELCGMLKSRDGRIPIYLVANEYSPETERAAWAARATLFDVKPMQLSGLRQWLMQRHVNPSVSCGSIHP